MLNVGGGEFLVILLVALIVLGPTKLPEVARQVGGVVRELRRMSAGFQNELKNALDDPIEEDARERGRKVVSSEQQPAPAADDDAGDAGDAGDAAQEPPADDPEADDSDAGAPDGGAERSISTAEAAGMYDVANRANAAEQANREAVQAAKAAERAQAAAAAEVGEAADRERQVSGSSKPAEAPVDVEPAGGQPTPDLDLGDTEAQA